MAVHFANPVLAAFDFGSAVSIIFLLIAFLSWILQAVGGANKAPARRGPKVPPQAGQRPGRNPALQDEIDSFLAQVRQRGGAKPDAGGPPPRRPVAERPPRPQPQQGVPPRPTPPVAQKPRQGAAKKPPRGKGRAPQSEAVARQETIEQHHLDSRISKRHLKHLKHTSDEEPTFSANVEETARRIEKLGVSMGEASERPPAGKTTHPIVSELRDPRGVRNAIIMLEVLGRPKALQRKTTR